VAGLSHRARVRVKRRWRDGHTIMVSGRYGKGSCPLEQWGCKAARTLSWPHMYVPE